VASPVRADVVAGYDIARAAAAEDLDAIHAIAADDVAVRGRRPADRVARGIHHQHAAAFVAQARNSIDVGAYVVARDHVAGRVTVLDEDAVAGVAADNVASGGRRAADGIVGCPEVDPHAALVIAEGCTGLVDANEVADNLVVRRAGASDKDAVAS